MSRLQPPPYGGTPDEQPQPDEQVTLEELLARQESTARQDCRAGRHRRCPAGWVCLTARTLERWDTTLRAMTLLALLTTGVIIIVALWSRGGGPVVGIGLAVSVVTGLARALVARARTAPSQP